MTKKYEIVELQSNEVKEMATTFPVCPNGFCPNAVCCFDVICSCIGICDCPPDNKCAPNPDHNCGLWSIGGEEY